jgi:hypothetical protein
MEAFSAPKPSLRPCPALRCAAQSWFRPSGWGTPKTRKAWTLLEAHRLAAGRCFAPSPKAPIRATATLGAPITHDGGRRMWARDVAVRAPAEERHESGSVLARSPWRRAPRPRLAGTLTSPTAGGGCVLLGRAVRAVGRFYSFATARILFCLFQLSPWNGRAERLRRKEI